MLFSKLHQSYCNFIEKSDLRVNTSYDNILGQVIRLHGQAVKTAPSQGAIRSSILLGVTIIEVLRI